MPRLKKAPARLPADLKKFRDSYERMFGVLPPLPAARFEFSADVDPQFLRLAENLRAHAFYTKVFDAKTTQLMLFGMLLAEHNPVGAAAHARAARRCGASWKELHAVVALASATGALGPANQGSALLKDLRDKERDSARNGASPA
jgi:alkylhydroperoxidase/carboxymuconolactone decarboxylase family protein YurZ